MWFSAGVLQSQRLRRRQWLPRVGAPPAAPSSRVAPIRPDRAIVLPSYGAMALSQPFVISAAVTASKNNGEQASH